MTPTVYQIETTEQGRVGELSATVTGSLSGSVTLGVPADFVEDFSLYSSTANFLTDPNSFYTAEGQNTGQLAIDADTFYTGYTKSLRYTYPSGTGTDYTITPGHIDFTAAGVLNGAQTDIWVEYAIKFASGFTLLGNGQPGGAGLKAVQIRVSPEVGGRFGVQLTNNDSPDFDMEGPNDDYTDLFQNFPTTGIMDGNWHVIRRHVDVSNASAITHATWIDGVFKGRKTSSGSAVTSLTALIYFNNLNKLAASSQDLWIGYLKLWTTSPGWVDS